MTAFLIFSKSIFNCEVIIKDSERCHNYSVDLTEANEEHSELLKINVASGDFELTVLPQMADFNSIMSEMEITSWKDKLAQKIGSKLFSLVDNMMLRVGCKYKIRGLKDGDTIYLCEQEYVFGTFDRFDLLNLIPMAYMFFEASYNERRCEVSDAFELNRKNVIASSRKLTLADIGLHLIFTYPFQIGRIKRLTSNKKIKKTLTEFSNMNENERLKLLTKKEKFMER